MRVVSSIVRKPFITEMDLLRLRQALLMCRMAANTTYLCTKKEPSYSSKLERLAEILEQLFAEQGRKAVLFSEWTTMLDLVEALLRRKKLNYTRLDGSVPQKQRQQRVNEFLTKRDCRLFLSTNAGATGLNLQAANTVINCDLPWNPAVLEQRIARAHRMGQKQPVQAFLLVTEQTIEESLLATLAMKKDLALAALDADSDVDEVSLVSGAEELRSRLEILLGAKPEAPIDESQKGRLGAIADRQSAGAASHRDRVAAAGGELLGAVFSFLGELVSQDAAAANPPPDAIRDLKRRLAECTEEDELGRPRLAFTLPHRDALDDLATTLAKLLVTSRD
jgi:superfamily II DNA/RNA helicase